MVYLEKKILIHNEPNMQKVIQACLTTFAGWNVRVANSTLEGVQQAILSQPETIIVEVSVGTENRKTILCRNGPQKLHLNSVEFSKNRCDITRCVKRCVLWEKNSLRS